MREAGENAVGVKKKNPIVLKFLFAKEFAR